MSKNRAKHTFRTGAPKLPYLDRITQEKEEWTRAVYNYTQQETLDAASLALHELFGFGPERLKRFGEAFIKTFHEIQELSRQDTGDNMKEYSVEKVEQAMREAWGPYYVPRGKRYEEISVIHGIKKG